jgi:hypothetical protein
MTSLAEQIEPTPTIFPTIHPYAGPPAAATLTPLPAIPITPKISEVSPEASLESPPYSGCLVGLAVLSIVGLIALALLLRRLEKTPEEHSRG